MISVFGCGRDLTDLTNTNARLLYLPAWMLLLDGEEVMLFDSRCGEKEKEREREREKQTHIHTYIHT